MDIWIPIDNECFQHIALQQFFIVAAGHRIVFRYFNIVFHYILRGLRILQFFLFCLSDEEKFRHIFNIWIPKVVLYTCSLTKGLKDYWYHFLSSLLYSIAISDQK